MKISYIAPEFVVALTSVAMSLVFLANSDADSDGGSRAIDTDVSAKPANAATRGGAVEDGAFAGVMATLRSDTRPV